MKNTHAKALIVKICLLLCVIHGARLEAVSPADANVSASRSELRVGGIYNGATNSSLFLIADILSDKFIRILIENLTSESRFDRSSAVLALYKLGEPAVPALLDVLNEEPEARAQAAIHALKIIKDAKVNIKGWIIFMQEQQRALSPLAARRLSRHGMSLP